MNIEIIALGKMKSGLERELVARYLERAIGTGKPHALTSFAVTELSESRASQSATRKSDEATAILKLVQDDAFVVALDEHGRSLNSEKFANLIETERDAGRKQVTFIIGGADGLGADVLNRADLKLNFSQLTWPHQLVRILLAEQLYRTTTILANHPYHRA